jgi:hypothetical protein
MQQRQPLQQQATALQQQKLQNQVKPVVPQFAQQTKVSAAGVSGGIRPSQPGPALEQAKAPLQPIRQQKPTENIKITFSSPEDFLGLTPQMLHAREPYQFLQSILDAIVEFSKKEKFLSVIYNIEQSPLQKTYVAFGTAQLNDPNPDREEVYRRLIADAKAAQQDYLTKEELEAFTDFRKELDKLLV